ncbi:MAG: tRNA-binding protein [FCB group bacterium]|nr:tRNA-binding protein [FCB group bacterium]
MISISDFAKLDLRVGTIKTAEAFPEAKQPSYKLSIDLGALGIRSSSAQITEHYDLESLSGRQVICAVNLGVKRIAGFDSDVLVLGIPDANGAVRLLKPDGPLPNGSKIS